MIISAAIKLKDETVWLGQRHHIIFRKMKEAGINRIDAIRGEQGFVDDDNNFLNRKEAAKYVIKCGQCQVGKANFVHVFNGRELFSEDITDYIDIPQ